jgi:hypothetical protein
LVLAALASLSLLAVAPATTAHRLPGARGCPVFPKSNAWNQRVDRLPVAANSYRLISSIGLDDRAHPARIGIPFRVVGRRQPHVPVSFEHDDESDPGPYPIPRDAPIEGGRDSDGDRHVVIIDRSSCRLYELFDAHPRDGGARWEAGSGAIFNLRSNDLRPAGWTSADAAGLPILPGLARADEVRRGSINHALRFTAERTRRQFIAPARHFASGSDDPSLPPMGLRVRLRASFDLRGYPRQARIVLTALKRYGMLLADNGSPWFISGAPSSYWDNDDLRAIKRVHGRDFEVVDTSG